MANRAHRQQQSARPESITRAMPRDRAPVSAAAAGEPPTKVRPLRRAARQTTDTPVEIVCAAGTCHQMTMVDVSETGIGLSGAVNLAKSEEIEVLMPGGHRLRAIVRWASRGRAGLQIIGPNALTGKSWQGTGKAPDVRRTGLHGWWMRRNELPARQQAPSSPHRWWAKLVASQQSASRRRFARAYRENGLAMLLTASPA